MTTKYNIDLERKIFDILINKGYYYKDGKIYNKYHKESKTKVSGYIVIQPKIMNKRYTIRGHRFIWYYVNKEIPNTIDHIDGNRSNNLIENLRNVNQMKNCWNFKGIKGYYKPNRRKDDVYEARIMFNGNLIIIGTYDNEKEARQAYLDAKKLYHNI